MDTLFNISLTAFGVSLSVSMGVSEISQTLFGHLIRLNETFK